MKSKIAQSPIDIKCDKCGNSFILQDRLKTKKYPDGIHISYFSCPQCKINYITLVTDEKLRKAIRLAKSRAYTSDSYAHIRAKELEEKYASRLENDYENT